MRVWHLALLAGFGLALVGCNPATSKSGAAKLQDDIIGKWKGKEADHDVRYDFSKDGTYTYESGNLKYNGKYKVVDDKDVDLTFSLTDEQLAEAKKIWQATMDILDKIKPPGVEVPKPPEPQKDNTIKYHSSVNNDTLTLGTLPLTKVK